ncbi:MAG: DUF1501 domain-containing protein [Pirellulales bacterium]
MSSCLDYKLTRRSMMGRTTAAGAATFLGFQVRDLFAYAGTAGAPTAEHVILFWNGGGMSHIDTWDPKPGRPTQGEFMPIQTSVPGISISEILPQVAKQMHHISLIRSIAGTNGDHGRATYQLQTSYNQTPNVVHPGMGSVVVHERERMGDLPAYITISGQAPRASYLGQSCEAYFIGRPGERDPYLAFPSGIAQERGDKRLDILARVNKRFAAKVPNPKLDATQTSVKEAVDLMRSPALDAFDLDKEKPGNIERYGENAFGRGCLLAKRLVETGVRFVQINRGGFDVHQNAFPAMRAHGDEMDPAIGSLIADLAASGKLEKTLIIMLSEFGRTPRINDNEGRDHHAPVFSCMMAGGGVRGGQVIGSSDEDGHLPKDRPVQVADIHASVCQALGINYTKEVMTPLQRPMKLVDGGTPVSELFA